MFRHMMADRQLSQRALGSAIGVSEGTIRNSVAYAEATDLRNSCAATAADAPAIAQLSVRHVRTYVALASAAPVIGNMWLDCGADLTALLGEKAEAALSPAVADGVTIGFAVTDLARLERTGLIAFLPRTADFANLVRTLRRWDAWEQSLCVAGLTREMLRPYTVHHFRQVWGVRDELMIDRALGLIVETATLPPTFVLTPEEFALALRPPEGLEARKMGDSADHAHERVEAAILAKTGHLPTARLGVESALRQAELEAGAPLYIRESALPMRLKVALWRSDGWGPLLETEDPAISLEAAKRELAQHTHLVALPRERPEGTVMRHLVAYYEHAHIKRLYSQLTTEQMADTIARRIPLYSDETDRDAIAVMAATLGRLMRRELVPLRVYGRTAT